MTLMLKIVCSFQFTAIITLFLMVNVCDSSNHQVYIQFFEPEIAIISSKQKPRKIFINGSDGFRYQFLLKGKEDLRLDERVMQLFDLMNNLIQMNNGLRKKDLEVIRYSITPITNNHNDFGGLLRWIDNSGLKI